MSASDWIPMGTQAAIGRVMYWYNYREGEPIEGGRSRFISREPAKPLISYAYGSSPWILVISLFSTVRHDGSIGQAYLYKDKLTMGGKTASGLPRPTGRPFPGCRLVTRESVGSLRIHARRATLSAAKYPAMEWAENLIHGSQLRRLAQSRKPKKNPAFKPEYWILPRLDAKRTDWEKPETFTVSLYDRRILSRLAREGDIISIPGRPSDIRTRKSKFNDAVVGSIDVDTSGTLCFNPDTGQRAAVVTYSGVAPGRKGWGPVLYDYAALVARSLYGIPLVSDRNSVSPDAAVVWEFYRDRRKDMIAGTVGRWEEDIHQWGSERGTHKGPPYGEDDPTGYGGRYVLQAGWDCHSYADYPFYFAVTTTPSKFSREWGVDAQMWLDNAPWRLWMDQFRAGVFKSTAGRRRVVRQTAPNTPRKNPPRGGPYARLARTKSLAAAQRLYRDLGLYLNKSHTRGERKEAKEVRRELERRFGFVTRQPSLRGVGRSKWGGKYERRPDVAELRSHVTMPKPESFERSQVVSFDPRTGEIIKVEDFK